MSSLPMATYDPKQVAIIVGGKTMVGFGPDTYILVQRNNDLWSRVTGCDGNTIRSKNNDKSGKMTITLLESSPSNDDLSALYTADEQSNSGAVPFLMRDANGRTLCTALTSWVTKPADVEYGATANTRTWVLETGELTMFVGGN